MKSWTRHIRLFCAIGLAAIWALPAPAAQVVQTLHPMHPVLKLNKRQVPNPVVPPPPGQIRWKPDGSDRFQYMQAYREATVACVKQVFPPADPAKGISAAPDAEMTGDNQVRMAKCMAQTGMSAGPALFFRPGPNTAKYSKAAGNMSKHYMENKESAAILNMLKRFDKIYATRKNAYMKRLAMANTSHSKFIAAHSVTAPGASEGEAPPLYVVPANRSGNADERSSTIQPPPAGQLWVTPRSQ